eukprot:1155956-Pelagomonas_calceolata.AAC.6
MQDIQLHCELRVAVCGLARLLWMPGFIHDMCAKPCTPQVLPVNSIIICFVDGTGKQMDAAQNLDAFFVRIGALERGEVGWSGGPEFPAWNTYGI